MDDMGIGVILQNTFSEQKTTKPASLALQTVNKRQNTHTLV